MQTIYFGHDYTKLSNENFTTILGQKPVIRKTLVEAEKCMEEFIESRKTCYTVVRTYNTVDFARDTGIK